MRKPIITICGSPPRSGTTSITKMGQILGMKCVHVLGRKSFDDYVEEGFEFFCDTPCYNPMYLIGLIHSKNYSFRMIYIDRPIEEIKESMVKTGLNRFHSGCGIHGNISGLANLSDAICFHEINNSAEWHQTHKFKIVQLYKLHDIPLLIYKFTDGWKPFCDFLDKTDIPTVQIPHLNTTAQFVNAYENPPPYIDKPSNPATIQKCQTYSTS